MAGYRTLPIATQCKWSIHPVEIRQASLVRRRPKIKEWLVLMPTATKRKNKDRASLRKTNELIIDPNWARDPHLSMYDSITFCLVNRVSLSRSTDHILAILQALQCLY